MTDRPCRPRALVMFTPPEAEDLVCEDAADLLLARAAVTGVRPLALQARGAGELFPVDLRKVAGELEDGGWRAQGHSLQLHGPGPGLPQGARRRCGARDGRQRPTYRYGALNAVLGGVRHHRAQVHPSLQPPAERQGRADEPHAGAGMAVRKALTPFIDRYNWDRSHGACGESTPMPRIVGKKQRLGTAPSSQNA